MSPTAGDEDAARRRAVRRVARELHPDLGGDPEAYLAALGALADGATSTSPAPGAASRPSTGSGRARRSPRPAARIEIRKRGWGALPGLGRRRLRAWRRRWRARPGSKWVDL